MVNLTEITLHSVRSSFHLRLQDLIESFYWPLSFQPKKPRVNIKGSESSNTTHRWNNPNIVTEVKYWNMLFVHLCKSPSSGADFSLLTYIYKYLFLTMLKVPHSTKLCLSLCSSNRIATLIHATCCSVLFKGETIFLARKCVCEAVDLRITQSDSSCNRWFAKYVLSTSCVP